MPRSTSIYVCQQCDYQSPNFLGKCPECGTWNSLVEQIVTSSKSNQTINKRLPNITRLLDIDSKDYDRVSTKIHEFDRVLGGGIVKGSVVLVSGDPGIGKSTLLSQLAINVNSSEFGVQSKEVKNNVPNSQLPTHNSVLYVAGEESGQQIKLRIQRIDPKADLAILNEVDVDVIIQVIDKIKPKLVIVDSIQTMETQDLQSTPGSVGQVRESAHRLQKIAKSRHIPIFIVGHVTKEGTVAGPKTLEHMVDVVLTLEGDSGNTFRVLRSSKNRFGPTDEVGIFEMVESGMEEVKNPSKIFLEQKINAPGSAVMAILTGLRPMLLEVQALVTKSFLPMPRRIGAGIDNNRLQLLVAVLSKRLNLPLFDKDIFVNITGGIRVVETASDLAICMAIISSLKDKSIKSNAVLVGEIGLLGELRSVRQVDKRMSEASRLGFTNFISPANAKTLAQAMKLALDT